MEGTWRYRKQRRQI